MPSALSQSFREQLATLDPSRDRYATEVVDLILRTAQQSAASDVHLVPDRAGLQMDWRIDGVLQSIAHVPDIAANIIARLKVLAQLLTYRTDVPQEGRIIEPLEPRQETEVSGSTLVNQQVEMRVSTFPTLHGEKAVIRLFVGSGQYRRLSDLCMPTSIDVEWRQLLTSTNGVLLISGPAGSGKTTTLYASLREILHESPVRRSIVTLEDPIEAEVPGVTQSQVNVSAGFDYARGLRSLLRQDPEVIMVGEIRDRETAETSFQASLSGNLVLTSFHAGSSSEAISRVSDLGVEPYLLRSGLLGILSQRLLRRLCECAESSNDPTDALGLTTERSHHPNGCEQCEGTGYSGRLLLSELLNPRAGDIGRAMLTRADADELEQHAVAAGMQTLFAQARKVVEAGETSPAEVRRLFSSASGGHQSSVEVDRD